MKLLLLFSELVIDVDVLLLKFFNLLSLDLLVLFKGLDGSIFLFYFLLKVLFLGIEQLGVSFLLGLLLGELVNFVFFLHNFFSLLGQFTLELNDLLVE